MKLSGFSREQDYRRYRPAPEGQAYCQVPLDARTCLGISTGTPFNGDFRRPAAVPPLLPRVAPRGSDGMLTVMPSPSPLGLGLGPD